MYNIYIHTSAQHAERIAGLSYLNMQTSFAKEKKPYVVGNFNLGIDPGNYSTLYDIPD